MEDKSNTGNTAVENAEGSAATPVKKAAKSKSKTQRVKASHPPTSEMVTAAIKELKDRKGSSLQAIKKYIAATYKVDGEKFAPFIKRYLKAAVTSGAVVQTKGKGASGSFKLSTEKTETKTKTSGKKTKKVAPKKTQSVEKKTVAVRKPVAAKKPPSAAAKKAAESAKKAASPKKTAAKPAAAAKTKAAAEAKNISKTKKTAKAPAAKTKTPKPKKAATPKTAKAQAKK